MHELSKAVSEKYIVILASFEGVGDDMFRTEERFCSAVFEVFARSFRFKNKDLYNKLKYFAFTSNDFNKLSDNITDFIEDLDKDVILMKVIPKKKLVISKFRT